MELCGLMCNPPKPGDESYELWKKEYDERFNTLSNKSKLVYNYMTKMDGIKLVEPTGALYVYPKLLLDGEKIKALGE